jgi:hypothetical protein
MKGPHGLSSVIAEARRRARKRNQVALDRITGMVSRSYHYAIHRLEQMPQSACAQDNHSLDHFLSFLAGMGLGVGAGLLFAPTSGEETRKAGAGEVNRFKNGLQEPPSRAARCSGETESSPKSA